MKTFFCATVGLVAAGVTSAVAADARATTPVTAQVRYRSLCLGWDDGVLLVIHNVVQAACLHVDVHHITRHRYDRYNIQGEVTDLYLS